MRGFWVAIWLAGVVLPGSPAAAVESYSAAETAAAAVVHSGQLHAQEITRVCMAQAGERAPMFPFAQHFWRTRNLGEILPSDLIWPTLPPAQQQAAEAARRGNTAKFMAIFNAADGAGKDRICGSMLESISAGKMDFSVLTPAETQVLKGVFERTPGMRVSRRNADMVTGCMKSLWNKGGRNFASIGGVCECSTKATTDQASDEEIDAYLAGIEANRHRINEYLMELGWFQRAQPAIAACLTGQPR